MTVYELIKTNETFARLLKRNNVSWTDIENMEIYERFLEMKSKGHKTIYCVAVLCDEYKKSQRTLYSILKSMRKSITFE